MDNLIMAKLSEYYSFLENIYGERLLGVFLYGSQNYNFQTSNSDIDAKAIIVPTLWDIASNKAMVSKEYHIDDAHLEVKDFRLMVEMWKKQNMNFLEILFTQYRVINPKYQEVWNETITFRELMANYNGKRMVLSISHQGLHALKENTKNGKKFANAARMVNFLDRWLHTEEKYGELIRVDDSFKKEYLPYKEGKKIPTQEQVDELIAKFNSYIVLVDNFKSDLDNQKKIDEIFAERVYNALTL